uniref:Uncharacterized protein n=1 Tax=Anguilla anguilla TaxID=7936 RepID=A0A0E9UV10_ANGAN
MRGGQACEARPPLRGLFRRFSAPRTERARAPGARRTVPETPSHSVRPRGFNL